MEPMRPFVAGVYAVLLAVSATAELTVIDAVERAVANSPSLHAAASATAAAEAAADESRSTRFPSVTFGGSGLRYSDPWIATPIHGFNPYNLPEFDRTLLQ